MTASASDTAIEKISIDPMLAPGAAVDVTIAVRNPGAFAANAVTVTGPVPHVPALPPGWAPGRVSLAPNAPNGASTSGPVRGGEATRWSDPKMLRSRGVK